MPVQPGVNITTPPATQFALCKVDPIANPQNPKTPMGFVVRDPAGKPVRQFVSYDGKNFNIRAFYLDGVEAYREVYPPQQNEPSQFRWLGPNGSKWGLDHTRSGRIDEWVAISPEELSQELLQAVITRDAKRAEALALTKGNLDALGVKGPEAERLLARTAAIGKKVTDAAEALKATPDARWVHLELSSPHTTPADSFGGRDDLVAYKNGTILVQDGKDGKTTKFVQTGEIVQIGRAWKLVDGPGGDFGDPNAAGGSIPAEIAPLVAKLNELDQVNPAQLSSREAVAGYNVKRAELLEQIVAKLPPEKQEQWQRLLIDALSAASEGEKVDGKHITRLKQVRDAVAKSPNASLAAFAGYRCLIAENNIAIATSSEYGPVQEKWRTALEEFYKAYPNSEEAPEALLRLAMAYEYQKDGEPKAKEWYATLAQKYSKHTHAAKAAGAIKRLESEGKPFELVGAQLENGQTFNAASLAGRTVIVFYCASWSSTLAADASKLQGLLKQYGPKGLELVTICLDADPRAAGEAIAKNGIPGVHLFAPGGLDGSPLASSHGILLCPHLFVVGKDGKVVNRNAQLTTIDDDLRKLMP
jgi:hypothetical protein